MNAIEATGAASSAATDKCLNCGAGLRGSHCHDCGQPAHVHRSVHAIGHEIAHGVFHFEGKIWRTLPMLILRPGELTRRYIHGERARFVSPLALFLFAVFLTFAVLDASAGKLKSGGIANLSVAAPLAQTRTELANLIRDRAALVVSGKPTAAIDRSIADKRDSVRGLETATGYLSGTTAGAKGGVKVATGWPRLDEHIRDAAANPSLLLYKLQSSAYKYAWALIVLSLPFMWLVFPARRDLTTYDHAIFVTYSISTMMLLLVVAALVSAAVPVGNGWVLLVFPVHLFMQLRGAYRIGVASALARTAALLMSAVLVVAVFAVLLVLLGLLA